MKAYNEYEKFEYLEFRRAQNRKDITDGIKAIGLFLFLLVLVALLK